MKTGSIAFAIIFSAMSLYSQPAKQGKEQYRPQLHFSPEAHWMNDPNGMVYYKGTYHLFYQYYPGATNWGPMHWGHATSSDLIHWVRQPVALYPDSLGYIFSGSAVVDEYNTSGLGKNGKAPLVAIFTHHDPKEEKAGMNNFQNQSLAFSLDEGRTWEKYSDNPVLHNPGITDFRDPKVMWYEPAKKWVMTLATKDRITFYSAPDLKNWTKESEFGANIGAHGGVWECPDLFLLKLNGKTYWVLLVSINPGAPNGGSGTQYFIGDFNGKEFKPINTEIRWVDYGTDNYAGVTWSNTRERKIFIGWMSNWNYADKVPTVAWRGAATLPRELKLISDNNIIALASVPVRELATLNMTSVSAKNIKVNAPIAMFKNKLLQPPYKLQLKAAELKNFTVKLNNKIGEELLLGYDEKVNRYYIDRHKSGKVYFDDNFSKLQFAPKVSHSKTMNITIVVDVASVEMFADEGLTVMTSVFFSNALMDKISIQSAGGIVLKEITYRQLKSVYDKE